MTVLLLGHGLSTTLTGIERLLVGHAAWWQRRGEAVRVTVDDRAAWPDALPAGVEVVRLPRPRAALLAPVPASVLDGVRLVHSFGAALPRGRHPGVYTVYDWGPLRDRSLAPRARLVWSAAMVRGVLGADVVHAISARTRDEAPGWLRRRGTWRVAAPTGLPPGPSGRAREPGLVLYVGAVSARKRVAELVAGVHRSGDLRLELVGAGTAAWSAPDGRVRGLGAVSDAELRAAYDRCSVVALLSTYEGFGIPVREALDRGVPVVASRAVAACHPDADPGRLVVVDEPPAPAAVADALRRAVALGPGPARTPRDAELDALYDGLG